MENHDYRNSNRSMGHLTAVSLSKKDEESKQYQGVDTTTDKKKEIVSTLDKE